MQDLKGRTVRGGLAKVSAQGANFALRLGSLMVLARLLEPADFGLVAMVTAILGVLGLFRDFGLSTATIQRADITDQQMSTLFWINLLAGAILTCLALIAAPLLAMFYREPRLLWVTLALAPTFLLNGAGVQHSASLQRQMRFTLLAAIETIALVVSVAVGLTMALTGFGYWSLVGMAVASPLVYTLLVWRPAGWVPGPPQRQAGLAATLRFGGTVTLNGLVVYAAYNTDKILLGRIWGPDALGVYSRAYQLINIPTENLNGAVGGVAFSALSRLHGDPERLRNYFLKGYSFVVAITVPVTLACLLLADDLIAVVLGAKWLQAVPIFRLLAPTILIYAVINPLSWLLLSQGLVGRSLRIALVLAPLVIAGYGAGLPFGPTGVAFGFSAVMVLWVVPHVAWCVHGTSITLNDVVHVVGRPLLAAVSAAAVAVAVLSWWSAPWSPVCRLLVGMLVLFVTYAVVLLYVMGQGKFYLSLVSAMKRA